MEKQQFLLLYNFLTEQVRLGNEYVGSLEVLKQTSVTFTTNRLQLRVHIANFPSFVALKGIM